MFLNLSVLKKSFKKKIKSYWKLNFFYRDASRSHGNLRKNADDIFVLFQCLLRKILLTFFFNHQQKLLMKKNIFDNLLTSIFKAGFCNRLLINLSTKLKMCKALTEFFSCKIQVSLAICKFRIPKQLILSLRITRAACIRISVMFVWFDLMCLLT